MKDTIKEVGLIVLAVFVAGALLNLLDSIPQTKAIADYVTKGYGTA